MIKEGSSGRLPAEQCRKWVGRHQGPWRNRKRQRDVHQIRVIIAAVKGKRKLSPQLWVRGDSPDPSLSIQAYRITDSLCNRLGLC